MAENEKPSKEEEIQSNEPSSKDEIPEKKKLSEKEEKAIFGLPESKEEKAGREIYKEKTEFEILCHRQTGMFPQEWVKKEVEELFKADNKLIRNWEEINIWLKDIALNLNNAQVMAQKIKEFCPERCPNPFMIAKKFYLILGDDEDTIAFVAQSCMECPLFAYGNANALALSPEDDLGEYQVGKRVSEIQVQQSEKTVEEVKEVSNSEEE